MGSQQALLPAASQDALREAGIDLPGHRVRLQLVVQHARKEGREFAPVIHLSEHNDIVVDGNVARDVGGKVVVFRLEFAVDRFETPVRRLMSAPPQQECELAFQLIGRRAGDPALPHALEDPNGEIVPGARERPQATGPPLGPQSGFEVRMDFRMADRQPACILENRQVRDVFRHCSS